jgi:chorismate mutase-like protein
MRTLIILVFCAGLFAQPSGLTEALQSSRQRIDSIDGQIVKLLNERARVVQEVGTIKRQYHAPASAPGREEQVLRRVSSEAEAPLTPAAIEAVYKAILHEMSAMEASEMEKDSKSR